MRHLNYNHLLYFWTVAREGSITKATKTLHLTPQTISGQLKLLEEAVGEQLFDRVGRGLVLTDTGHLVLHYADEIFSLGQELSVRVKSGELGLPTTLKVGLTSSLPKLIGMRILQPSTEGQPQIRLTCREGSLDSLLGDLAIHQLDLIISDSPLPAGMNVKAYSHKLGDSNLAFFVQRAQARRYRGNFPACLDGSPLLFPTSSSPIRRALEDWFQQQDISPRMIAEFDDSAMMKAFGEAGVGVFPSPGVISAEIESMYKCRQIGQTNAVKESYYAISPERKLKHPQVLEVITQARNLLKTGSTVV